MGNENAVNGKLEELEEEYSKTKHNKATNKHLGILRAKIARLKKEAAHKKSHHGTGFSVKKSGNATVALVGFPNAGKSSLLKHLTNVESKVADYAFTTIAVIPGIMEINGAKIQVLDLPGIIEDAYKGRGGGTMIGSVIRIADLIAIVVDAKAYNDAYRIIDELHKLNIFLNEPAPDIRVEKKTSGGIRFFGKIVGHEERYMIEALNETGIYNADITFGTPVDAEKFINYITESTVYTKSIIILNKVDLISNEEADMLSKKLRRDTDMDVLPVSASKSINMDNVKRELFQHLNLIKVYLKPKDGVPDLEKPLVLRKGATVGEAARAIHSKTAENLKYATVTGTSTKFDNQRVGQDHILHDEDIITLFYYKII